ncbi:major facilitator superfamily domain-containing protein [Halteromyces radiatus]|uniref:major facilitator superfamily domain-containing protein n=1 Tax=Halteromyces radiatus TaxID=101107 RepID=UPI00221FFF59|nr:major facilitator superfamily domain-containing protein [Halteromyces radiatus]KAI8096506.1 major facilitator superfamily domain-containing protein [Halteromyces radiatus]
MNALSWIGSLWLAMAVILGPVYGYVAYKIGYRWILIGAVLCNTIALMMASIANEIWQLMLTQGVLAGFGASLAWFPCISAPQQYFTKRRGFAVGVAISGSGFGGLVMSNIVEAINSTLGIRWSLRVVGFINLALLSFAACVVRPLNPPPPCKFSQSFNLKPFQNVQFCLLFCIQLIGNFAFNVPSSYLPSYADHLHLDRWIRSNLSAILSGVMIIGKIGSGTLSDYIGRANMCTICIMMTGVMCLVLWLPATNSAEIWAFAATFGLFGGGYMVMVPAVLAQCVGMDMIEASNGLLFFAWFFGGLFGSPICAALIDSESGNPTYSHAIIFGGVLMVFAGCLAWAVRVLRAGWNPFIKA